MVRATSVAVVTHDLVRLVRLFERDGEVRGLERWTHLVRLFEEQCLMVPAQDANQEELGFRLAGHTGRRKGSLRGALPGSRPKGGVYALASGPGSGLLDREELSWRPHMEQPEDLLGLQREAMDLPESLDAGADLAHHDLVEDLPNPHPGAAGA